MGSAPIKWLKWFKWLCAALVLGVSIVFAVRQYQFVDRYSLNIMLNDQWDIYPPIFEHRSWWTLFTWQHGPHRQGVAFLITPLLARMSGCNTRWDSFSISYTMMAACGLGLLLGSLCGARHPIALLPVPMMYLTAREYASFSDASNLAHGAMPMLLFTALCLAWFIRNHALRIALISVLTFGLIFTGFGIFVGLLTPVVLLIEGFQAIQQKQRSHAVLVLCGLIANAISWGVFSIGYVFDPANPDFKFPYKYPLDYFGFAAMMLSNFYGAADRNPLAVPLGLSIIAILMVLCILHARRLIRGGTLNNRLSIIIFLFASYALIYCFNTAIGRVSLNWQTASLSTRYVILMVPAGMAIFLQLATLKRWLYAVALPIIYALLIAPGALQLTADDWADIRMEHDDRRIPWRNAYFATHNQTKANDIAHFQVYLYPDRIENSLKFMETHRLNFFQDEPPH